MNPKETLETILIFGAGSSGLCFYKSNKDKYTTLGFVDNDVSKNELLGLPVYHPTELPKLDFERIVIASVFVSPIFYQLTDDLAITVEKILFHHPIIENIDDFKLLTAKPVKHLPNTLAGNSTDVVVIKAALLSVIERFKADYYSHNSKLILLLEKIKPDDFYTVWQDFTQELIYDNQYSEIFFSQLNPEILKQNTQFQNKVWLPKEAVTEDYAAWSKEKNSATARDKMVWPLLRALISMDLLDKSNPNDISMLFFFRDILFAYFVCDKHRALQKSIFSICYKQKTNWALPYCNCYPYQGMEKLGITGFKPSEQQLEQYALGDILSSDKVVLDIGSNCGFLGVCIAEKVKHVDMVEYNPYLTSIADKVIDALGLSNVGNLLEDFTHFKPTKTYDVVFSLANHCTIDGNLSINFEEYIAKCFACLKPHGYLIFESHNVFGTGQGEAGDDSDLNEKFSIVERYFRPIRDKMTTRFVPINDVDKLVVVLQRRTEYLPNAKRTFDLSISRQKYHY